MWFHLIITLMFMCFFISASDVCFKKEENCTKKDKRYLFYDVNRQEGFNLRRDVYLRFAVLANKMKNSKDINLNSFYLVLPPWFNIVHWDYNDNREQIPWGLYFDLSSLKHFAPVLEMYEFFDNYPNKYSKVEFEELYTLQHFEDMFETGNFEDRMKIDKCLKNYEHSLFFYKNVTVKNIKCLSYHGPATKLSQLFLNTTSNTIVIEHAEVALHDYFGGSLYWQARRSMRFNKKLKIIAAEFREKYLNSNDKIDNTILPDNWQDETPKRNALGGPYLGIHLRRRDFVRNRPLEVPSIKSVSIQVKEVLAKLKLDTVFVATDGTLKDFQELSQLLSGYKVVKYIPPPDVKAKYGDGGIAIIDQIICSYARYFIGTHESTFTFRIQEEREILGFKVNSTFNVFCGESGCPKSSVWQIVY